MMLIHSFNDLEALRVAVEIERSGRQFYRSVMGIAKNPEALALLEKLASHEAAHMQTFERLYREEAARAAEGGGSDAYDAETNAYLSAVAAEIVFPGGAMARAMKRSLSTMTDVLLAAIGAEKDSILFYMGVIGRMEDPRWRDAYQSIINEEWKHLYELQTMLEDIPEIGL